MNRTGRSILVAAISGMIQSAALAQAEPSMMDCRVTAPNGVVAGDAGRDDASYGNALLSAGPFGLWPEGTITFKPGGGGFVASDGALGMKFGWTQAVAGELRVSGRRLDGVAQPLRFESNDDAYRGAGFQASYLIFPAPGCWEVNAQIGERADSHLTFVTRVVKIGEGPNWRRNEHDGQAPR
jgi:hypothetical protein